MKIHLCNEVLRHLSFAEQCATAAALGYDGLEIAPFTLDETTPHRLPPARIAEARRLAADAGMDIVGLHWLLVAPPGLSITSADPEVLAATEDVLRRLIDLCAALGGRVLVHGSPKQRALPAGEDRTVVCGRVADLFARLAEAAGAAGVTYCLEPLARAETDFINTVADAARLVDAVGHPAFRTMIDTSAAGQSEVEPVCLLARRWIASGHVAHIQLNDRNRRGPGEGNDRFGPLLRALHESGYGGGLSIEPFRYEPDPMACAARSIGYVRGVLDGLETEG